MAKSFYHFLMKYRDPEVKDPFTQFANGAYHDHSFPKQSRDYHEISSYLELNGQYIPSMAIFDQVWEVYRSDER
ncbi:YozE family protein [Heyndrickxia acidiproducens]|uniref:YozE family protein n=1 Tax=Heyndrickxia acidiproducens TaxID=1121084 RepID=UPI000476C3F3|nr:YozE family protein [Heyndrickxia acidiproducens]